MLERFVYAVGGAILGALIVFGVLWFWVDTINWVFVIAAAGACAVPAFVLGKPFLKLLEKIWWWT